MFRTIVWATDGSASAEKALPVAKGLAQPTDAELVLAHVEEVAPCPVLVVPEQTG